MEEFAIHKKAEQIRDVIRYIKKFKNALILIYLDDSLLDSPLFPNHIKDICLVHEAGFKVVLVPGASRRISEILSEAGISWTIHDNCRITEPEAMPLIKMAAFDVSNQIMTAFAGEGKTAVIGNWVRARGKGVIDGFYYGTSGEIDKLQIEAIKTVLDSGFIPIFPCIGWSAAGKPYNISSIELSQQIAIQLQADKLFFLVPGAEINSNLFSIPESIALSPDGTVPALNLEELELFIKTNELSVNSFENSINSTERSVVLSETNYVSRETSEKTGLQKKIILLLQKAKEACKEGVSRIHILNGSLDGSVPCEIFSNLGSGTMIYSSNYGKIRNMTREDIPAVLNIMKPFIEKGILLPRTNESLSAQFENFIVYELDGAIRACASLVPYTDGQMEIAGVAVDSICSHMGIGPKMVSFLVKRAKKKNATGIFLLTTKTADWFENLGFKNSDISSLPEERKKIWNPARGSKVLRLSE